MAASVDRRDFEVAIVACCERIEAAQGAHGKGDGIQLAQLLEDSRFLVETFKLLSPDMFRRRPDPNQKPLFPGGPG